MLDPSLPLNVEAPFTELSNAISLLFIHNNAVSAFLLPSSWSSSAYSISSTSRISFTLMSRAYIIGVKAFIKLVTLIHSARNPCELHVQAQKELHSEDSLISILSCASQPALSWRRASESELYEKYIRLCGSFNTLSAVELAIIPWPTKRQTRKSFCSTMDCSHF